MLSSAFREVKEVCAQPCFGKRSPACRLHKGLTDQQLLPFNKMLKNLLLPDHYQCMMVCED